MLLANANEEFLKGLLLLDTKGGVHVYPESARQAAQQAAHNTYLYTADTQAGLLTGYSLAYSTAQVRSQVSLLKIPSMHFSESNLFTPTHLLYKIIILLYRIASYFNRNYCT